MREISVCLFVIEILTGLVTDSLKPAEHFEGKLLVSNKLLFHHFHLKRLAVVPGRVALPYETKKTKLREKNVVDAIPKLQPSDLIPRLSIDIFQGN